MRGKHSYRGAWNKLITNYNGNLNQYVTLSKLYNDRMD